MSAIPETTPPPVGPAPMVPEPTPEDINRFMANARREEMKRDALFGAGFFFGAMGVGATVGALIGALRSCPR